MTGAKIFAVNSRHVYERKTPKVLRLLKKQARVSLLASACRDSVVCNRADMRARPAAYAACTELPAAPSPNWFYWRGAKFKSKQRAGTLSLVRFLFCIEIILSLF